MSPVPLPAELLLLVPTPTELLLVVPDTESGSAGLPCDVRGYVTCWGQEVPSLQRMGILRVVH